MKHANQGSCFAACLLIVLSPRHSQTSASAQKRGQSALSSGHSTRFWALTDVRERVGDMDLSSGWPRQALPRRPLRMWDLMDTDEGAGKGKAAKRGGPSLLEAESFAAQSTELGEELAELRNRTVEAALRVAAVNPTARPNLGRRVIAHY